MRHLLILLAVFVAMVQAQAGPDWLALYGSSANPRDQAVGMAVDPYGYVYVAGDTNRNDGDNAVALVRYTPAGTESWVRIFGDSTVWYQTAALALDNSRNSIVAITMRRGRDNGFRVIKCRADNVVAWTANDWHSSSTNGLSGLAPVQVTTDERNDIYVVARSLTDTTGTDIVLTKFSRDGVYRWTRYLAGQRHDGWDFGWNVQASGASVYITGVVYDNSNRQNLLVAKYDSSGTFRWSYQYLPNSNLESRPYGLAVGPDGSIVAVGTRKLITDATTEALVVKLTTNGDTVWTRADSAAAQAACVDDSGNVYVVGRHSNIYLSTMRTWKYSLGGRLLWRRDLLDAHAGTYTTGWLCVLDGSDYVYTVGNLSVAPYHDYVVARYTAAGQLEWSGVHDTTDRHGDYVCGAALGLNGSLVVSGTRDEDRLLTMKYRSSGAIEEPAAPVARPDGIMILPSVATRCCRLQAPAGSGCCGLRVVDVAGRTVRSFGPVVGSGAVLWDLRDDAGAAVANGVYLVLADGPDVPPPARIIVQR